jgi:hypothetical protein
LVAQNSRVRIVNKPKPGTRYPSASEPSGYWIVPKGCIRVALDSLGRPMWSIVA